MLMRVWLCEQTSSVVNCETVNTHEPEWVLGIVELYLLHVLYCVHTVSGSFGSMEWGGGLCPNDAFSTPLIQ